MTISFHAGRPGRAVPEPRRLAECIAAPMPAGNSRNAERDYADCCLRIRMLRDTSPPFPLAANANCGFSFLELLIVVAIIAVLTSLVLLAAASANAKARQLQCI